MPYQYSLSVTDELGALQLADTGGDCTFAAEWEQDQWFPTSAAETVYLKSGYTRPHTACLSKAICLRPSLIADGDDDGFAAAEDPYDDTKDVLEVVDDPELLQFWQLAFALPAAIPQGRTVRAAYVSFRTIDHVEVLDLSTYTVQAIDSLETDAPEGNGGSPAAPTRRMNHLQLNVTGAVKAFLAEATADTSELNLQIGIVTAGETEEIASVASSRHTTISGPKLILIL